MPNQLSHTSQGNKESFLVTASIALFWEALKAEPKTKVWEQPFKWEVNQEAGVKEQGGDAKIMVISEIATVSNGVTSEKCTGASQCCLSGRWEVGVFIHWFLFPVVENCLWCGGTLPLLGCLVHQLNKPKGPLRRP